MYSNTDTAQRAALTSELQTDPRTYGYAADITAKNDQALADKLNLLRTAANSGTGVALKASRGVRSGMEVMSCIDAVEFAALLAGKQQYIIALVSPGEVDLSNAVVRTNLDLVFIAGATRTRLMAIADKTPASRAEELFGVDTFITPQYVAQALGRV
jgi:hypothetical protein